MASDPGSLIAPCQSRPRMIAVGTSETKSEAIKSQRLADEARARSGTSPGTTGGSSSGMAAPLLAFCASGAKRSAMMVGVGSGSVG